MCHYEYSFPTAPRRQPFAVTRFFVKVGPSPIAIFYLHGTILRQCNNLKSNELIIDKIVTMGQHSHIGASVTTMANL